MLRQRLETLGEPWDETRYAAAFREYDKKRNAAAWRHVAGFLCLIPVAFIAGYWITSIGPTWALLSILLLPVTTLFLLTVVQFVAAIPIGAARWRFFYHIGFAIKLIWTADRDEILSVEVLLMLNHLGSASRALFVSLQGSRRTWRYPPMVSDRALQLSAPLIDMEIPDDLHMPGTSAGTPRKYLDQFLRDVAAVAAIGREDLIPRVRDEYPELKKRSSDPDARDRDLNHLNPMRTRSRWDVAKDFWYPLASWLSLFVAAAALFISIAR